MIDLSKTKLNDKTASILKTMGVRLYVDYHNKDTFINQAYWREQSEVAKLSLCMVHINIEKEIYNER